MTGARSDPSTGGAGKQRKRKNGTSPSVGFSLSDLLPGEIVYKERDLKRSKTSTELALLLGLMVVAMYLFGFVELMESMPEISNKIGHYKMGANLNLARMEMTVAENLTKYKKKKDKNKKNKDRSANKGEIEIPVGVWPVSVKNEETETMIHVGDLRTVMKVPKFWAPPLHNNKLFTREQSMKIGTCAEPDPVTGSVVRGDACPTTKRTIFIGIASYRDYQCRLTVESAFNRAKNPERIRIGVVDQVVVGEDVACDEPVKPCDEDPEQVRTNESVSSWNRGIIGRR